jgi:RNA polymerase sigma factor (sigma-70 family)
MGRHADRNALLMSRVHEECCLTDSDQRLVELARDGSVAAFEAIVLRYQAPLLRHCRQMLTPAEAEDAVQEAFLAAFRTIRRTGPDLRLGGWLFRIAHNAALGILRRRTLTLPLEDVPSPKPSVDEAALQRLQLRDTLAAISRLPLTERHALVERALAGRGHREIALTLGRSDGAVRQLLHRARTRLREGLAALAPLVARLAPASGDQQLAGASLAAKSGLILAVGVTAVGGGGATLSAGLGNSAPPATRALPGTPSALSAPSVVSASWSGAVSVPVLRSVAHQWIVTSFSARTGAGGGGQTTPSAFVPWPGQPTSKPSRRPTVGVNAVTSTRTGPAASRVSAQTSTQTATMTTPLVAQAPRQSIPAAGQSVSAPAEPVSAPGPSATTPGQAASGPAPSAVAPGRSAMAPGHSTAAPGQSAMTPGESAPAPGATIVSPGRSGTAPGNRHR